MGMLVRIIRFTVLVALVGLGILVFAGNKKLLTVFRSAETNYRNLYDDSSGQKPVLSHGQLDSIFNQLQIVHYADLPEEYLQRTGSLDMKDHLQWKEFYQVRGTDIFKYVVGHFRIGELMSKDTFYHDNINFLPEGCNQYWLMDRKLMHKFLDLILWMQSKGYNDSAISIKNGHRNPHYNKKVGGVSHSYHMQGVAIDLKVGDIDRNGVADNKDKQILLQVLETDIIGNEGGLGKYPGSDVIHFDTRGYRARWDKQ